MPKVLREYQENAVTNIAKKLANGDRKILFQLATGGGKCLTLCAIASRYTKKSPKSVIIAVHRKELLAQTRNTLYNEFGIDCTIIAAGVRYIRPAKVYVCMVESLRTRIDKVPTKIGMVIIDEAHIGNFNKLHKFFPAENGTTTDEEAGTGEPYIIGFTATPMSSSKKNPLKNHYQDIVCGVDIPTLIEQGFLCQNITYAPKETVDRGTLEIKNGEFDEGQMAIQFSKPKYVENTVEAYKKYAPGTKAIIFNCNIDHSIKVTNAFRLSGIEARHLDSNMGGTERSNIIRWFEGTPGAVMCNVGIATTGTDIPSIETVIMNRSTLSMPFFLQCTGRGARTYTNKLLFSIIDMGGNAVSHDDWNAKRDWHDLFHNPPKSRDKEGVAPVKSCPECEAIIPASSNVCKFCGYIYPAKEMGLEQVLGDFVVVTKGIDVHELIASNKDKKEYYTFFRIGRDLAIGAQNTIAEMTEENATFILQKYEELAKTWCEEAGKKFNKWHKDKLKENLFMELMQVFPKWKPEGWEKHQQQPEQKIPIYQPVQMANDNPFYLAPLKSL